MDHHMKDELPRTIYPRLQRGRFRVSTEAVSFFFRATSHDDFEEYADICRLMVQNVMFHTGADVEAFPLGALLGDVATQDHIDGSDAAYGVARVVLLVTLKLRRLDRSVRRH